MNKGMYRVVFSAARGMYVAVQETARSHTRAASKPGNGVSAMCRGLASSVLAAATAFAHTANAQIIADPAAPGNQRPTVLAGPNGAPLVNIQTPSAAGVSHNTYRQFDVNAEGAVLNNARGSNPWLAGGTARVILNEVNSHAPSHLRGAIAVHGDRAQVIVANPSGVYADGAHFVNANRVTLTTGNARFDNGGLSGFDVRQGTVQIGERGLNTESASYTDILSRSAHIIGRIQAHQGAELAVTTGANFVDYSTGVSTAVSGVGSTPWLAIDTAAIGGMYAGKITLLATEAGVGVRNAGNLEAAGILTLTADGRLENSGRIVAPIASVLSNSNDIANQGVMRGDQLLLVTAGQDFSALGDGLVQSSVSPSAVVVRSGRDINLAAGTRLVSQNNEKQGGALTLSAERDVNVEAGSNLAAGGTVQINAGNVVTVKNSTIESSNANSELAIRSHRGVSLSDVRALADGDLFISSDAGDITVVSSQLTAGRDLAMVTRKGQLSLRAQAGASADGPAELVTVGAQGRISLQGSSVSLQAAQIRGAQKTSVIATDGNVVMSGVTTSAANSALRHRQAALKRQQELLDARAQRVSSDSNYLSLLAELGDIDQREQEICYTIGHYFACGALEGERANALQRMSPYSQALDSVRAQRAQLTDTMDILSGITRGSESIGTRVDGGEIEIAAKEGVALSGASIVANGKVEIAAAGLLASKRSPADAGDGITPGIAIGGLVDFFELGAPGSERHAWATLITPSRVEGRQGVRISAAGENQSAMVLSAAKVGSSEGEVFLRASGDIKLEAGQEESYSYRRSSYTSGGWFNRRTITETFINNRASAQPSEIFGASVQLKSGGSIDAYATQFQANNGSVSITAANALNLFAVPELHSTVYDKQKQSRFLGVRYDRSGSVDTYKMGSQLPTKLVASAVSTTSGWNTLLQGTQFETSLGGAEIRVGVGENARSDAKIVLEGVRRVVSESHVAESNQVIWQRQEGSGRTVESLGLPSFNGPTLPILHGPVIAQIPYGDFRSQLELLSRQPGMGYLRTVASNSNVNWQPVKLAFEQWDYKQEGLTAAGAVLIALAVTVATNGMGASLVGPSGTTTQAVAGGAITKFTTTGIMANAAFSSIASQAAVTVVHNGGDIGKTLRMLASTDTVKSALIATAVAGTMAYTDAWGTTDTINGNKLVTDWGQRSQAFLVNTAVKGALTGANKASDWWTIAGLSLATEGFKYWVGREGDIRPGVNGEDPVARPQAEGGHLRVQRVVVDGKLIDVNNVGLGDLCTSLIAICHGTPISNALNTTPGFNSFATLHDTWGNWLDRANLWNGVTNIGSMPPALVLAYAHLADQYRYALPRRR